jgi:hypothetical protein
MNFPLWAQLRTAEHEAASTRPHFQHLPKHAKEVVVDLDAMGHRLHGLQEGRSFNAYYLIYSDCFRTLPAELKRRVHSRLVRALDTATSDSRYDYIPAEERVRISKILKQTHPDFRDFPD